MEAREFLKECRRICKDHERCENCPIYDIRRGVTSFEELADDDIEILLEIIEEWAAEHPQKTRLDDLKEKYPDTPLSGEGIPLFNPWYLGYCKDCGDCEKWEGYLKDCWNVPLEEQPVRKDGAESCENCETCKYSGVIDGEYYCYRGKPKEYTCEWWEGKENG